MKGGKKTFLLRPMCSTKECGTRDCAVSRVNDFDEFNNLPYRPVSMFWAEKAIINCASPFDKALQIEVIYFGAVLSGL